MGKIEGFTKVIRITRLLFISFTLLFGVLLSIENINYYLVGYRSTSIVYLITTITGIVYILSDRRFILNSFSRAILNLVAVIFMMGSVFIVITTVDDFRKQLIYSDSKFRLEFPVKAPMSPCGLPVLFIKSGLIERKSKIITTDTCISNADISSVDIRDVDTGYLVKYFLVHNPRKDSSLSLNVIYKKP